MQVMKELKKKLQAKKYLNETITQQETQSFYYMINVNWVIKIVFQKPNIFCCLVGVN